MDSSIRSIIVPGLAAACAAAVVAAPSPVTPATRIAPVQLTSAADLAGADELGTALSLLSGSAAADSADEFLKGAYTTLEEWVRYGVSLIQWPIGLISYIPNTQIDIFYNLVESLIQNPVFNIIDGTTGTTDIEQALSNIAAGLVTPFQTFASSEISFVQGLLPPMPPIFGDGSTTTGDGSTTTGDGSTSTGDGSTSTSDTDTGDTTGSDDTSTDNTSSDPTSSEAGSAETVNVDGVADHLQTPDLGEFGALAGIGAQSHLDTLSDFWSEISDVLQLSAG